MLHLVRHGRPLVDPNLRRSEWGLDPAHKQDVIAPARSGFLPADAMWWSSPETKAVETARLLAPKDVLIGPDVREQERGEEWVDHFDDAVARAFSSPFTQAEAGWEPASETQARVLHAAERIIREAGPVDAVIVGHGFALTLLVGALTGTSPDIDAWAAMLMPDHCSIDANSLISPWGGWASG